MNELLELGEQMRDAQKKYFKTRMSYDLERAKKLEKQFDDKIKELKGTKGTEQKKLF